MPQLPPPFELEQRYREARPSLSVRLLPDGRPLRAVIDTGSTHSVFGAEHAEAAGVSLPEPPKHAMQSGGGPVIGWLRTVELELSDLHVTLRPNVFFTVVSGRTPLLGLVGVLDRVYFALQHSASRLWLGRGETYG